MENGGGGGGVRCCRNSLTGRAIGFKPLFWLPILHSYAVIRYLFIEITMDVSYQCLNGTLLSLMFDVRFLLRFL